MIRRFALSVPIWDRRGVQPRGWRRRAGKFNPPQLLESQELPTSQQGVEVLGILYWPSSLFFFEVRAERDSEESRALRLE